MLGLHIGDDEGFMIHDCHWHRDKVCMIFIISRLRKVGPIQVPTPRKRVRISQSWDTGGSRLCPLEKGFYEETDFVRRRK